jgi:lipopolysaccharide biosynthesis regulator YciM
MLFAAGWSHPASTQSPSQDSALLTEVRLLRKAIEALAGNGTRVQLVFGRLQLQEQRTTAAVRRLEDVRSALAHQEGVLALAIQRIKELEAAAADPGRAPEEARAIREALAQQKGETTRIEVERTRLAAEEAEAARTLSVEQGRWSDLNRQVEELERALSPLK